jgi:hypothetical protein
MVKEKRPNIIFLMETKCRKSKMEGIIVKLGFEGLFVVELVGQSGGLALLWKRLMSWKFITIQDVILMPW